MWSYNNYCAHVLMLCFELLLDPTVFSARQHMLSALYAIARLSVRLSVVCLSVCHMGGSVKNG